MGAVLLSIALALLYILSIPAFIVGILVSLKKGEANKYLRDLAISIDQLGNVLCQHLFNMTLIKKGGIRFGNVDSTISSVLGKNELRKTLSIVGLILCKALNGLDENHCEKAIDDEIDEILI